MRGIRGKGRNAKDSHDLGDDFPLEMLNHSPVSRFLS